MATRHLTKDLKDEIDGHEKRIVGLEYNDGIQDVKIDNLQYDVKSNEAAIGAQRVITDELALVMATSEQAIKFGTWIVGAFGLSIIAFIWSLITGQAQVIFQ